MSVLAAAALLSAVVVDVPQLQDQTNWPELLLAYDRAYFYAYPGCMSYASRALKSRYEQHKHELGRLGQHLVAKYGTQFMREYADAHADMVHGIYYIKCPSYDAKYSLDFGRALRRLATAVGAEGRAP